jgi:hypothetical protein
MSFGEKIRRRMERYYSKTERIRIFSPLLKNMSPEMQETQVRRQSSNIHKLLKESKY